MRRWRVGLKDHGQQNLEPLVDELKRVVDERNDYGSEELRVRLFAVACRSVRLLHLGALHRFVLMVFLLMLDLAGLLAVMHHLRYQLRG